jgi:hypothetical protein
MAQNSIFSTNSNYISTFLTIPVASFIALPYLVNSIQDSSITSLERGFVIIGALILKRIILYAIAYTVVDITSKQSLILPRNFGEVTSFLI